MKEMTELERRTRIGDTLQSAADRMADHIIATGAPYEVMQAAIEAKREVEEWTMARGYPFRGPPEDKETP